MSRDGRKKKKDLVETAADDSDEASLFGNSSQLSITDLLKHLMMQDQRRTEKELRQAEQEKEDRETRELQQAEQQKSDRLARKQLEAEREQQRLDHEREREDRLKIEKAEWEQKDREWMLKMEDKEEQRRKDEFQRRREEAEWRTAVELKEKEATLAQQQESDSPTRSCMSSRCSIRRILHSPTAKIRGEEDANGLHTILGEAIEGQCCTARKMASSIGGLPLG